MRYSIFLKALLPFVLVSTAAIASPPTSTSREPSKKGGDSADLSAKKETKDARFSDFLYLRFTPVVGLFTSSFKYPKISAQQAVAAQQYIPNDAMSISGPTLGGALEVGIIGDHLVLALEGEAAYCAASSISPEAASQAIKSVSPFHLGLLVGWYFDNQYQWRLAVGGGMLGVDLEPVHSKDGKVDSLLGGYAMLTMSHDWRITKGIGIVTGARFQGGHVLSSSDRQLNGSANVLMGGLELGAIFGPQLF